MRKKRMYGKRITFLIMTESEFCALITAYYGEHIDNIEQVTSIVFTGKELKEFTEYCLKHKNEISEIEKAFKDFSGI